MYNCRLTDRSEATPRLVMFEQVQGNHITLSEALTLRGGRGSGSETRSTLIERIECCVTRRAFPGLREPFEDEGKRLFPPCEHRKKIVLTNNLGSNTPNLLTNGEVPKRRRKQTTKRLRRSHTGLMALPFHIILFATVVSSEL